MPSLAMSRAERDAFLAAPRVGIVSIAEEGRGPLTVPVWYRYEPGGPIAFATGINSRKARLIRSAGRIGFCVQSETAPYQYVSVEGPVTLGEPDYERDIRQMAIRYLGKEMAEMYLATMAAQLNPSANVLVTLTPRRWYSVDYSKLG
jgi:nitroimidazol reductase NimA-like FMN-containing flavoprotein (pyridoxamine 5'-phosphate oxidase superfamily)